VNVCAVALSNVDPSASLLARLNDINSQLRFARIFWADDQVLVESEMAGSALSLEGISSAYDTVGGAANHFGALLAEEFGDNSGARNVADPNPAGWPGYL